MTEQMYKHLVKLLLYKLENIKDVVKGVSEDDMEGYIQELIDLFS